MQFVIKGTNNKGECLLTSVTGENYSASFDSFVGELGRLMNKHQDIICFQITIARPDPEVVEIKQRLRAVMDECSMKGMDFDDVADKIFDELDIKLKGKDNA